MRVATKLMWQHALMDVVGDNNWIMSARQNGRKIGKWYPVMRDNVSGMGDYRSILPNEIVFDIDVRDWNKVRMYHNMIKRGLAYYGVPHITAGSGGKGLHIHVFVKMDSDNPFIRVVGQDKIRWFLSLMILYKGGVTAKDIKAEIDPRKLNPREHSSLIRTFGAKKYYRKTYIRDDVPFDRRVLARGNVEYPREIRLWDVNKSTLQLLENMRMLDWRDMKLIKDNVKIKRDCITCSLNLLGEHCFPSDECYICDTLSGIVKGRSSWIVRAPLGIYSQSSDW